MTAGLTYTQQAPASAIATIDTSGQTVSDCWRDLFDRLEVKDAFIRSIRKFADVHHTVPELYEASENADIPYWMRSRIRDVALGDRQEAWHLAADVVPQLGEYATVEDILTTAGLFAALEDAPTIAFIIGKSFRDRRRNQREAILSLVTTLADGLDVRIVGSGLTLRWLAEDHRADLPGVSEWCNSTTKGGPLGDLVDDALEAIDPDGREVQTLRALADESSETLTYGALYAESTVKKARVRQCIGRLADLGLVETFGPDRNKKVELLEPGRRVLRTLDEETGRQQRLDEAVSENSKPPDQCRVTPQSGGEREDGPRPYEVGWMSHPNHTATAACGRPGGVTLVSDRIPDGDGRTHEVSYDPDRDEAVVAVRATEPLPYAVSTAVALATPWFLDDILSPARLEAIEEPTEILRGARCIGGISDEAANDPTVLRDTLVEWGQTIQELTRKLRHGEYDDRNDFRAAIMRSAHGLAGSIVHLLDAAGVDLVRELRLPSYADAEDLEDLAATIGISSAIQSRYNGVYNCYRQLYEERTKKRSSAFTAEVDAADPVGKLIGSLVIRGKAVHRLQPFLADALESPRDLVDDPPEFAVRVPISETSREAFATATTRTLQRKNLRPTREAVSLLHTLVRSPYGVAQALEQLQPEDRQREIRPDELRYALATLSSASILSDASTTVSKVVHALLCVEVPITSKPDLADRADVSLSSVYNHLDVLEALDLVRIDGRGYRLALSFRTTEERRNPVVPEFARKNATVLEAVDALLVEMLPPDRYGDPEDPVAGVLFWIDSPPDPWSLADHNRFGPWVELAATLAGAEIPTKETVVEMGPRIEQTAIQTATSEVSAG